VPGVGKIGGIFWEGSKVERQYQSSQSLTRNSPGWCSDVQTKPTHEVLVYFRATPYLSAPWQKMG